MRSAFIILHLAETREDSREVDIDIEAIAAFWPDKPGFASCTNLTLKGGGKILMIREAPEVIRTQIMGAQKYQREMERA